MRLRALLRLAKYRRTSTPITSAPIARSVRAMLITPSSQPPSPETKMAALAGVPAGT